MLCSRYNSAIKERASELSLFYVGLAIKRYVELELLFQQLGVDLSEAKRITGHLDLKNLPPPALGDVQRGLLGYPNEVVINDIEVSDGTSTPSGEPTDDFFSSWDKPAIKKPTPPISRTATPPVVGRTPSPFLSANSNNNGNNNNGTARSTSPLSASSSAAAAVGNRATL
ncbi:hypothetical protein SPI_05282 [Niveomyces insectorum RCEF 264]|uniref:Uncharacterized protein n=1 Tax=Niveomyces insectorum RCEF 264 TaxID=1081102 RepID=A0A167U5A5_9HYPO|nr:hypothetical protein SPI_05282 [Niveomyces insectorum RCEF 264]